jgi:hypothetical protein
LARPDVRVTRRRSRFLDSLHRAVPTMTASTRASATSAPASVAAASAASAFAASDESIPPSIAASPAPSVIASPAASPPPASIIAHTREALRHRTEPGRSLGEHEGCIQTNRDNEHAGRWLDRDLAREGTA